MSVSVGAVGTSYERAATLGCMPTACSISSNPNLPNSWWLTVAAHCCAPTVTTAVELLCTADAANVSVSTAVLPIMIGNNATIYAAEKPSIALGCGDSVSISPLIGTWAIFDLFVPEQATDWEIKFDVVAGDLDFYLAFDRTPNFLDWDLADFGTSATVLLGCSSGARAAESLWTGSAAASVCTRASADGGKSWRLGVIAYCCSNSTAIGRLLCPETYASTATYGTGPQDSNSSASMSSSAAPLNQATATSILNSANHWADLPTSTEAVIVGPSIHDQPAISTSTGSIVTRTVAVACGDTINYSLAYGGWAYFDFTVPRPAAGGWELVFNVTAGDPDFYLAAGRAPGLDDWDLADFGTADRVQLGCGVSFAGAEAQAVAAQGITHLGAGPECSGGTWRLGVTAFGFERAAASGQLLCFNASEAVSAEPTQTGAATTQGSASETSSAALETGDSDSSTAADDTAAPGTVAGALATTRSVNAKIDPQLMTTTAGRAVLFTAPSNRDGNSSSSAALNLPATFAVASVGTVGLAALAAFAHRLRSSLRRVSRAAKAAIALPPPTPTASESERRLVAARLAAAAAAAEIAAGLQPPPLPPRRGRGGEVRQRASASASHGTEESVLRGGSMAQGSLAAGSQGVRLPYDV